MRRASPPALGRRVSRHVAAFTLLEVVVALAIAGLVITLAAALLRSSGDLAIAVSASAERANTENNGERVLRRLVGQMSWRGPGSPPMRGTEDAFTFAGACDVPAGWREPCTIQLTLEAGLGEGGLAVETDLGERFTVKLRDPVVGFLYLASPTYGGRWTRHWVDGSSLPFALGIVLPADTLILRVGERG